MKIEKLFEKMWKEKPDKRELRELKIWERKMKRIEKGEAKQYDKKNS